MCLYISRELCQNDSKRPKLNTAQQTTLEKFFSLLIFKMHRVFNALLLSSLILAPDQVLARDVPANVRALYNSIRAKGECTNKLKDGFYSQEEDSKGTQTHRCLMSLSKSNPSQ